MKSNGPLLSLRVLTLALLGVIIGIAPANAVCERTAGAIYITKLRVTIQTGGDDLRGGRDNVSLALNINTGGGGAAWVTLTGRGGLNGSARWADWSSNTVDLPVTNAEGCQVALNAIRRLRLTTSFSGGMSGDNWNMRSIHVDWFGVQGAWTMTNYLLDVPPSGHTRDSYVFRFTGDRQTWEHDAPPHF